MMKISNTDHVDWGFITHEERKEVIESDEEIVNIEELDTIDQGGTYETYYKGYLTSVEAWINFSIYR